MEDRADTNTVDLLVERRADGSPVTERVLVESLGGRRFRILASPGLLAGLAADDEIELQGEGYRLLKRGGNVAVQYFAPRNELPFCAEYLVPQMASLGGRVDGRLPTLLVLTIPVAAGFPAIERVLGEAQRRFPRSEWMYGNVYNPEDGHTPLNWWR